MDTASTDPVATTRRKSSFAPVVADDTRVLLLGSLPGEASLAAGRYYAHPRNRFWQLMGKVIEVELEPMAYERRLEALLAAGVGLWDTVASARREGSLDTAMREIEANPLRQLVASLPELRAVGLNGAVATRIGTRLLGDMGLSLLPLPSSSPAFAAMTLADKQRRWLVLREYCKTDLPPNAPRRIVPS